MRRYFPDIEQFKAAAKDAEVIPVYRQLLADRVTPVGAFEVLGGQRRLRETPAVGSPSIERPVPPHD